MKKGIVYNGKRVPYQKVERFLERYLPDRIGVVAKAFVLENFKKEGFQGRGLEKWPPRKRSSRADRRNRNRRALLQESGRLRRSITVLARGPGYVVVGSKDVPYAAIHNEGGTIRTRNAEIDMPQRRFVGDSPELDKRVKDEIDKELKRLFT